MFLFFSIIADRKLYILVGVITPTMAIKRHKRGDCVYLAEYKSYREGGKVKSKYVRYIGPEDKVTGKPKPAKRVLDRIKMSRSYRAGDVGLLWQIATDLDFIPIIDRICTGESEIMGPSPGKLLTIWAINRAIDPESATQLQHWAPTTDLPRLAGLPRETFTKDAFLTALDFVSMDDPLSGRVVDLTDELDDALYQNWRRKHPLPPDEKETCAYDLTSVLFFGVSCPLAELGYNPNRIRRRQVNLALLVSQKDKHPITHFVYKGNRHTASTVKNLLARLADLSIEPGTLIWDRGNVSKEHVDIVDASGWKLVCGVPKTSDEACNLIETADIPINPTTLARSSQAGHIYAVKSTGKLYGDDRTTVVYTNREREVKKADSRNEALAVIGKELDELSEHGKSLSEKELRKKMKTIIGKWDNFIDAHVSRKKNGPRIKWTYKKRELRRAEQLDGKWLLLSTDDTLSAEHIVNTYLEKDFIEKVFRVLKTHEEVEPVRHRLERRVRAYLFVCVLAYRLLAVLQWTLKKHADKEDSWESGYDLLRDLSRVERIEVKLGNETKIWYLNLTKESSQILRKIGMRKIFKEERRLDM